MPEVHYTLKNKISTLELAVWVHRQMAKYSTKDALMVAHFMQKGERWSPPIHEMREYRDVGPCELTLTPDPLNEREIQEAELQARIKQQHDWLTQGADGDAQAAIDYCKAELAGEIWHPSGAPYA